MRSKKQWTYLLLLPVLLIPCGLEHFKAFPLHVLHCFPIPDEGRAKSLVPLLKFSEHRTTDTWRKLKVEYQSLNISMVLLSFQHVWLYLSWQTIFSSLLTNISYSVSFRTGAHIISNAVTTILTERLADKLKETHGSNLWISTHSNYYMLHYVYYWSMGT